jgi:prophage DNA circulation protein
VSTIRFDVPSWKKAGDAITQAATSFKSNAEAALANVANTGSEGLSVIDGIIAGIQPAVMEAVNETVAGLAAGLTGEGDEAIDVGIAYAEVEHLTTQLAGLPESELY